MQTGRLKGLLERVGRARFHAKIFEYVKRDVDLRVYVTDRNGIVLFDSRFPENVGKDYSRWNDVYRTLRGEYGARSTRNDPDDPFSGAIYVASPVTLDGNIVGVVTVAKPKESIYWMVDAARLRLIRIGVIVGVSMVVAFVLIFFWISSPIRKLIRHVNRVKTDRRTNIPSIGGGEIGELARAFEEMRSELEGRNYVERYVQSLTHELKSPLSAIRGAAEILADDPPDRERRLFLKNIGQEAARMEEIVQRMLDLSAVESRKGLKEVESVDLCLLAEELSGRIAVDLQKKGLRIVLPCDARTREVRGEPFLIRQAIENLLQNAVDFASENTELVLSVRENGDWIEIEITDTGELIPDYALDRIFERFYSLPRGVDRRKSSGLGLPFVREVAQLHGGSVVVENLPPDRVRAILVLPIDGAAEQ